MNSKYWDKKENKRINLKKDKFSQVNTLTVLIMTEEK